MTHRILKSILKHTKQHEDIGSLIFGGAAFLMIMIAGAKIFFSHISFNTLTQNILVYVQASIPSALNNVTHTFEPRIKTVEETSETTQNETHTTEEQTRTHRTTTSDTLWKLAIRYYNDGYRWTKIYEANKKVIPDSNKLDNGITLVIPE